MLAGFTFSDAFIYLCWLTFEPQYVVAQLDVSKAVFTEKLFLK